MARRVHRWLALIVGVQLLVWTLTGLYMVAIHIDYIRGQHLIRDEQPRQVAPADLLDPLVAARGIPGATGVKLAHVLGRPVWIVAAPQGAIPVHAVTGAPLPAPGEAEIRRIARSHFNGAEAIKAVELLRTAPSEVRGRKPPLWRVRFAGWSEPTLYFTATTGELAAKRHEMWRVFDLFFGLHIMDYREREDPNNLLLRLFSWSAFVMAAAGAWLLAFSFPRRKHARGAA